MESFYQGHWILTVLIVLPLLGALAAYMAGEHGAKRVALGVGIVEFLISLPLFWAFNPAAACAPARQGGPALPMANCVDAAWFPEWGIHYRLGMDGISLFMVLLTTLLLHLMVLGSWTYIRERERGFYASLLALTSGVVGVFVALDMFLFYVFWEVMLIPMYLLIGIWGGQRRLYASIKFVIYTMVGSLVMLVAIFYLYVQAGSVLGEYTTDLSKLMQVALPYDAQVWCFAAFALAFAIKVPLFPLHTWLPDAHVEAPPAGSVILAGVLLKFGIYGFL
ncbi:NADH-quinone oxidoreductase subunit M, partial [Longimicrobium sp.]|uniref:complex I subunit 4 family protein n=1 Tax=Longimicrobium sp. TaxID=2029185 RepID=UPI002E34FD70